MGRDTWDAVLASTPLNATAGSVTSKGYAYEPNLKPGAPEEFDAPPKSPPIPKNTPDLSGTRFGRLTVVRYHVKRNAHGSGWLCRCDCGTYVIRRNKSIKNPTNTEDRCRQCRNTAFLARVASDQDRIKRTKDGYQRLFNGGQKR